MYKVLDSAVMIQSRTFKTDGMMSVRSQKLHMDLASAPTCIVNMLLRREMVTMLILP